MIKVKIKEKINKNKTKKSFLKTKKINKKDIRDYVYKYTEIKYKKYE